MRKAIIKIHNQRAGLFIEENPQRYIFQYDENYEFEPISFAMPVGGKIYEYNTFPPFFDGLLPEGIQLEGLLKKYKIDRTDLFGQLVRVGTDLIGAITVEEILDE